MADDKFPTKYFIVQRLWSNERRRNLEPGETVPLDDLSDEQIAKLMAGNVIMGATVTSPASRATADQLAVNPEPVVKHPRKSKTSKKTVEPTS